MRGPAQVNAPRIRKLLRAHQDGMTAVEIGLALQIDSTNLRRYLHRMGDVYIDRWHWSKRGWIPVWCAVEVPEDCPKPESLSPRRQIKEKQDDVTE